jgi:hypothetical protein
MAEARILKITRIEKVKNGYVYDLIYSYVGNEYEVERFYEYNTLQKGDIIYV